MITVTREPLRRLPGFLSEPQHRLYRIVVGDISDVTELFADGPVPFARFEAYES